MQKSAQEFLEISAQFRLGNLTTETPHPKTQNLSDLAKNNLPQALDILKNIDQNLIEVISQKLNLIDELRFAINKTLSQGNNIFLCGCGATGRLSLALETFWRETHQQNSELENRVISFMAGGDVALISSIESFEDHPEYGKRQLVELGFTDGDLLISCTEGGETPFVIGATEHASLNSKNRPYFLYCNPDSDLAKIERSQNIIKNSKIEKINLTVGPMALSGSTRMQASSILMLAVGMALLEKDNLGLISFKKYFSQLDQTFLIPFIEEESRIYKNEEYLMYQTNQYLGLSILTDTTERSPTFSLFPFENYNETKNDISWCYLNVLDSKDSKDAWNKLLWRDPRTFKWENVNRDTSLERLLGYDISNNAVQLRMKSTKGKLHCFKIVEVDEDIVFELAHIKYSLEGHSLSLIYKQVLLKILLNNLSTLIMGRLSRYEGNLMTWVKASNNKLVDRACRYAQILIERQGRVVSYEQLVHICFKFAHILDPKSPLVLKLVSESLKEK